MKVGGQLHAPLAPLSPPQERDTVPMLQDSGWTPGLVWTVAENLALTGIRSSDRPDCSQSLYRLRYPGRREWSCTYCVRETVNAKY